MKKVSLFLFLFCFFVSYVTAEEPLPANLEVRQLPIPPVVELPANYDDLVKNSKGNSMEKKIDEIIGSAIKTSHVVIEKLNDFIFLQVVPNFAYADENGEERLGEDLMKILNSGKISASVNSQFMSLDYTEMRLMGLPFKQKLVDSLVLGADKFDLSISLTFFININKLTNMVLNSLENVKDFKPLFNQNEKFYRTKFEDSKMLYFIRIPNIAYEIAYTGELYENVIAKQIKEALFIHDAIKNVEKKIEKDPLLSFDGRYIKGVKDDKISVDLWFLPQKTGMNSAEAAKIINKVLKHEAVKVTGSEKEAK
ncbi:hypothetical protein J6Z19_04840 [bacterium]|nr:hypothetical protein [bacterium]